MDDHNPIFVTEISGDGPIIDVTIKKIGSPFAGLKANGLIDTGATDIVISSDIAEKLDLRYVNPDIMNVAGGGTIGANVYSGFIEVPALNFKRIVPLHAVVWKQTSHTILLGREFLRHFIFYYDGPKNMFHFSKPMDGMYEFPENLDG